MKINWKNALLTEQGLTNDNFLDANNWIRQSKTISEPFLNHLNEQLVLTYVAHLNVPVKNYYQEKGHWYYITQYITNSKNLYQIKITPFHLKEVALLLKELHKINVSSKIEIWNWKEKLNLFKNLAQETSSLLQQYEVAINNFFENYQPQKLVLCHNDLVPGNFLFTPERTYLIDYEYAMINDPLFDLASFISETLFNSHSKQDQFLQEFNLSKEEKQIINWWIFYQNLIWYYWAIYLFKQTKKNIYHEIAIIKLTKLKENYKNKQLFWAPIRKQCK